MISDIIFYIIYDIMSDIISDVISDIISDVISDMISDIISDIISDERSDVISDIIFLILRGYFVFVARWGMMEIVMHRLLLNKLISFINFCSMYIIYIVQSM